MIVSASFQQRDGYSVCAIYESSLRFYFYLAICVCTMHVCHQRKQCQQVGGSSSVSSYSTVLPPYLMFGVFLLFLIKILVHHLSVLMGPGFSPFTDWCEADTWTLGTDLKKESNQKRIFSPSPFCHLEIFALIFLLLCFGLIRERTVVGVDHQHAT